MSDGNEFIRPLTGQEPEGALPGRVQVVVRVRPTLAHEEGVEVATRAADAKRVEVLTESAEAQNLRGAVDTGQTNARVVGKGKVYDFDACMGAASTQQDVFEATRMGQLVDQAMDGYTVTLFAYGQTGSGKTYTVVGPRYFGGAPPSAVDEGTDGLLPRAYQSAFASLERRVKENPNIKYTFYLTCVEVYNEQVTDLTASQAKSLAVRHDKTRGGFYVEGLGKHAVGDLSSALQLVHSALVRRHVGSHRLNPNSTRSHCILTLHIESEDTEQANNARRNSGNGTSSVPAPSSRRPSNSSSHSRPGTGSVTAATEPAAAPGRKFGKLVLVDLAGSERLKETGQTDEVAVREAGNINRSLFALGKVLSALSQKGRLADLGAAPQGNGFVPYRDSKLTQLLFDGLKGTGRVLMVACCGPSRSHVEETMNTLHFAQVALHIKSEPVVVLDPHDQLVIDLKSTIVQLKAENRKLAHALKEMAVGKDLSSALRSVDGPALSGTLKNVLGVGDDPSMGSPLSKTSPALHRPKSMPALNQGPLIASVYGAAGAGKKKSIGRPGARQMLRFTDSTAAPSTNYDALPPLARKGAPKNQEKLQNLKKLNQQVWKAKGQNRKMGLDEAAQSSDDNLTLDEFPELLALESQFQQRLAQARGFDAAGGGSGDASVSTSMDANKAPGKELSTIDESLPYVSPKHRKAPQAAPTSTDSSTSKENAPPAEPKAVRWAERNKWFGTDIEMTSYAYEVHDALVELEGVDPNSDHYYDELDKRVGLKFPGRVPPPPPAASTVQAALKGYNQGLLGNLRELNANARQAREREASASGAAYMMSNNSGGGKGAGATRQPRQAWNAHIRLKDVPGPASSDPTIPYIGVSKPGHMRRASGGVAGKQAWDRDSSNARYDPYAWGSGGAGSDRGGAAGAKAAAPASGSSDYARTRALLMQQLKAAKEEAERERKRLMRAIGSRLATQNQNGGWVS